MIKKKFKTFLHLKKTALREFLQNWMEAVHFLSEYGRIVGTLGFKNLELEAQSVSLEERENIFDSVFLCESVQALVTYKFSAIKYNTFYQLDSQQILDHIGRTKLAFL